MTKAEAESTYPPGTKIAYSPYSNADTEVFTIKGPIETMSDGRLITTIVERGRGIEITNISLA